MMDEREQVVVIGTGFGGLAAAVRLRAMGYSVLMVEARDQPGGRAGVFRRDGYIFDAGPTVITAPYLFEELFELVGRKLDDYAEFVPIDPYYRITFSDGMAFDYVGDEKRLIDEVRRFNPEDVDGYRRLAAHAEQIFELGYEELADEPFESLVDMLRLVPSMIRLQNYRSVYGLVSRYISDERLRRVFSFQPLLVGGNPCTVTSIYLLIHWVERKWGVHFSLGGTTRLVRALTELLDELGVQIRYGTTVDEIVVKNESVQAVRTAQGEEIPCQFVVCNGDPTYTYRHLVGTEKCSVNSDRRLSRIQQSMGLFVGYFATDRSYDSIAHHTIVMGERYRGLLSDIFEKKVLADDFSLYLHRPTATDRSMAPEGHDVFYVLSPVPNNESDIDWTRRGGEYFQQILRHLEERHLPGLSDHLTTRFWTSPDYFENSLRSTSGAGFGPEPKLRQSAWFRYHNRSRDVDGLYFVGAGVHPGAGLPGVVTSAKVLEKLVPIPRENERIDIPPVTARVSV